MKPSVSLGDVVRHGQRRPAQLRQQDISLLWGQSLAQSINLPAQFPRLFPNLKLFKSAVRLLTHTNHRSPITNHNSLNASVAARAVSSISSSVCASDMKPTSNWDGAR